MPSANVTIEATFVKQEVNPKTGAYIPYIIFTSAILMGIFVVIINNNRKNKIWKV